MEELQNASVDQVVICGAMRHMCVDATTRATADLSVACALVLNVCAIKDLEFNGVQTAAEKVHGSFMAALGSALAA